MASIFPGVAGDSEQVAEMKSQLRSGDGLKWGTQRLARRDLGALALAVVDVVMMGCDGISSTTFPHEEVSAQAVTRVFKVQIAGRCVLRSSYT